MKIIGTLGRAATAPAAQAWRDYLTGRSPFEIRDITTTVGIALAAGTHAAQDDGALCVLAGEPSLDFASEIRASGHVDRPQSPAHRFLAAYRKFGDAFLRQVHGPFAVAIVDSNKNRVLLAIDRMGICKLAYAVRGDQVAFGVSAADVARFPGIDAQICNQALFNYLMMHMVSAPDTIFKGVYKLPPATRVLIENGTVDSARYWSPTFSHSGASHESLHTELLDSLRTAVRETHPDAATGAFLSGGLDSSTVAGVLSEVGPAPAKTFSIGFGYADYDELDFARMANDRFGCVGHEYVIHGDDIVQSFAAIARAYDEPFGNSSALPAYYCARMAKERGVDHLLAGDGGDELFAGNSRYADQQVFEYYRRAPSFLRSATEFTLRRWPAGLDFSLTRKARSYIEQANVPLPARLENWNLVTRLGVTEMLDDAFLRSIDPQQPFRHMQDVWDSTPSDVQLHRMLYYDWQFTLADNDLRKVQTMCELAGVKVSYPMLHHGVVDFSTRIPPHVMMPGRSLRHFYKQAMRGYLPDAIIHKKKHGFGLPFGLWLQESAALRDLIFGNLASLRRRRIVRDPFVDRLLSLHGTEDARYYGVLVWVLAMLEQWLQEHKIPA